MHTRDINLKLFGAMRRYGDQLTLQLGADSTVEDLRRVLLELIGDEAEPLVSSCAVATDSRLLHQREPLRDETDLAMLPPVSGG